MPDAPTIPGGYVAYGWHSFASGGLGAVARLSVVHLVPEGQSYARARNGEQRPYGPALCGRKMTGRTPRQDSASSVEGDLRRGEREPCKRCFAKAGGDDA